MRKGKVTNNMQQVETLQRISAQAMCDLINFSGLGHDFTPYVTKYADNGRAKNVLEVKKYFQAYQKKSGFSYLSDRFMFKTERIFRKHISPETKLYKIAKPFKEILR